MYSDSARATNGTVPNGNTKEIEVRGSPFHGAPFADYPFTEDEPESHGHGDAQTTNLYLAAQAKGGAGYGKGKGAKRHENGGLDRRDNPYATSNGSPNGGGVQVGTYRKGNSWL